jgi:hypothetical protein
MPSTTTTRLENNNLVITTSWENPAWSDHVETVEAVVNGAAEDALLDVILFDGELAESVKQLYYAAEAILEALGVDPSEPCKLCDTTFGFHTNECPTHEMNIATDAVAEWVR